MKSKVHGMMQRLRRLAVYVTACVWRTLMFRVTFIAITGSVGKTTAKEALAAILESRFPIVKTEANWNSMMDLARTVLRVRPWHRFAVLEVATSGPGWMKRMAWLARPDIAVILRVARTHMNQFRDEDEIAQEKARLLTALRRGGIAVLNGDDPRVAAMAARARFRVVWFGSSPAFDTWADQVSYTWPEKLAFRIHTGKESRPVRSNLVGAHWVTSLLGALAVAHLCGVSLDDAAHGVERLEPVSARMQPVTLPSGAVMIRDEENGAGDTVGHALRVLETAAPAVRKVVVLSDISSPPRKGRNRRRVARLGEEAARAAQMAVFIGMHAQYGAKGAIRAGMEPEQAHHFLLPEDAAEFLKQELRPGDLVLLKGRSTDHLSRIFFAQFGSVACWKAHCAKTMLCDDCSELGVEIESHHNEPVC